MPHIRALPGFWEATLGAWAHPAILQDHQGDVVFLSAHEGAHVGHDRLV